MICEGFSLTYPRIAESSSALSAGVDQKVDDSIESFLRTLSQIGPELLSGCLTLSFFERRATRQLFGLVSHEERVVYGKLNMSIEVGGRLSSLMIRFFHFFLVWFTRWEQWILRVVVNNTPRPINDDNASVIERQRIQVRLPWFGSHENIRPIWL